MPIEYETIKKVENIETRIFGSDFKSLIRFTLKNVMLDGRSQDYEGTGTPDKLRGILGELYGRNLTSEELFEKASNEVAQLEERLLAEKITRM